MGKTLRTIYCVFSVICHDDFLFYFVGESAMIHHHSSSYLLLNVETTGTATQYIMSDRKLKTLNLNV